MILFLCKLAVFRGSDIHLRDIEWHRYSTQALFLFHVSSAGTCRRGVCGNSRDSDSGEAVRGMTTMHHSNRRGVQKFQKPIWRSLQVAFSCFFNIPETSGEVRKTLKSTRLTSHTHVPLFWCDIYYYTLRFLCLACSVCWEDMNKRSVFKHKALSIRYSLPRGVFAFSCGYSSYSNGKKDLQLPEQSSWVVMPFNADFQTDSAPTPVTIRSWYRSSDLDSMYRSLRTLPLWRKGWARIGTGTVPEQHETTKQPRIYQNLLNHS